MFRWILLIFFLLLLSFLFPVHFLSGQALVGQIQGTVRDSDNQPIPGSNVRASSPSLIGGTATTFTDQQGYYRFAALLPGVYQVKVELQGFQAAVREGMHVTVGSTLTVDLILKMVAASESVTVRGEVPLVDRTTTATSFTVPTETLQQLPKPGSIKNVLSLTPGVGDDLVAYGGAGESANRIWVDGVDMDSPAVPALYAEYDYNWIQEAQVTGIGAPAEYGGYTGVVGNFVTKSGGNDFHGLVETLFQNQKLVSTNTPNPGPESPFKSYEISAQIGGAIQRNKLWFFVGLHDPYLQSHPFGYDGIVTQQYPKAITKLTYRMNENNTLQGFAHYGYPRTDGLDAGPLTKPEATSIDGGPELTWNLTWISILTQQTSFDARLGGFWAHRIDAPRNGDTPSFRDANGVLSRNAFERSERLRFKPQANLSLSHHADQFLGTHDFKFGAQIEWARTDFKSGYSGGVGYEDYNYGGYLYHYRGVSPPPDSNIHDMLQITGPDFHVNRFSGYAQDDWNISDRLTLSLGVRWDHNRGITDRGTVFKTDPVAPRLGFIWKPAAQTVFKAHYGDYYDAIFDRLFLFVSDNARDSVTQIFDGQQWIEIFRYDLDATADSKLRHPFVREFTAGVDQELSSGIALGAHYIHRKWKNILEDINVLDKYVPVPFVNPLTGETITVFNNLGHDATAPTFLTNPPGLFRKYDAVEFFATRKFTSNLSLTGSFVYSRITGNVPNVSLDAFGAFTNFLNDPNQLINFTGRLVNDPSFAWKIVGTYNFPFGLNTGWFFRHQSGDTWAARVRLPRSLVSQGGRILGEPLGSNRLPSQNILDLRVEKQFRLFNNQLSALADIFNVFNTADVTAVDDHFEDTTFGMPTAYTDPGAIRLGLRYSF